MADFRQLPWMVVALAALGLGACGGGSDGGSQPAMLPAVTLTVQRVFAGLPSFSSPVAMLQAPGDSTRWFVVEQAGRVRVFDNNPVIAVTAVFVDISANVTFAGETGLLGMAFHPAFPTDTRVYLFYSHTDATLGLMSRLSEFKTRDLGLTSILARSESCSRSANRRATTTAAASPSGRTISSTSGSATAAVATISTHPSATRSCSPRCLARCCVSTSRALPMGSRRPTRSLATRFAAPTGRARRIARKSSLSDCAIRGDGVSTG